MNTKCRDYTRILGMCLAVFVMISVFFYGSMEVRADSSATSREYTGTNNAQFYISGDIPIDAKMSALEAGKIYRINYGFTGGFYTDYEADNAFYLYAFTFHLYFPDVDVIVSDRLSNVNIGSTGSYQFEDNGCFIYQATDRNDALDWRYNSSGSYYTSSSGATSVTYYVDFNYVITSIEELSVDEVAIYQEAYSNGYDAGHSAGEASGYNQGYSDGEERGYTDGYDAGYESGLADGKASVDADEVFQAGYNSGYASGYEIAYEEGYDLGYKNAMSRLENAGADTADYPLLVTSGEYKERTYSVIVKGWTPFEYDCPSSWRTSIDIDPNHTYMFKVNVGGMSMSGDSVAVYQSNFNLDVGGIKYRLSTNFDDVSEFKVYVPGERMTSTWSFVWNPIAVLYGTESTATTASASKYAYITYGFELYDCGPSGDTQNHIANQTDQLTNGYDSSAGDSMNESFSASLTEYQTAEDSLFSAAQSGLDSFTFVDFTSYPALVTAMSFVTSMMTSIFSAMGGETGPAGIVLSVLFSVMLVSMVIGLYRYFQSKGKGGDG